MGMEKHQSTFVSVCEIVLNSVGGHVLNVGHLRLKRKIKKRRRPAAAAAHLVFVQKYFLSSSLSLKSPPLTVQKEVDTSRRRRLKKKNSRLVSLGMSMSKR